MKRQLLIIVLNLTVVTIFASKLPSRAEISLNGTWSFIPKDGISSEIKVPDYWDAYQEFKGVDDAVYEREVMIPASPDWKDKLIRIEFEAVNFIADIYIDDQHITSHIGGWISFAADITPYVTPGKSFTLKVHVRGGNHYPVVDENKQPVHPIGFFGQYGKWGIVFDVWMRAYGQINVNDTFIQTSWRERSITVDYQLENTTENNEDLEVKARIISAYKPDKTVFTFPQTEIKLKANSTTDLKLYADWEDPHEWEPGDPFLYYLETTLIEKSSGREVDKEIRRFGFREIWVEGTKIMLNGQRLTILGANIVQHSEFFDNQNYYYLSPESWNRTIDRLFDLNLRTVRFHMQPAPRYILDIADERGLLVIDEAAIYAREFMYKMDKKAYLENCYTWIESWVKDRRNHPSVIIWNAENEMGVGWLKWMTSKEMKSLGDEIRKYDKTRPVNYDGDRDVGDELVNLHYPEVYKGTIKGSIYSWADSLHPDKPTGVGEFITHYGENGIENQWWMGTFIRGMRYVYFSDIRPYRHDWALLRSDNTPCIDNLRRSLSPIALFDKEYDDQGIEPLLYNNFPIMYVGDTLERELVLYNDEFSDTTITIEVLIRSTETHQALYDYNGNQTPVTRVIACATRTYFVPLGEHVDIPYKIIVPSMHEGFLDRIEVDLIARKRGEVKFKETIHFALRTRDRYSTKKHAVELELYDSEKPDFFGR